MAAKTYTDEQRAAAARAQLDFPLDSDLEGVKVAYAGGKFTLDFAFSPAMAKVVRAIPGAAWDKEQKAWIAPAEEYTAVREAVADMRELRPKLTAARAEVEAIAAATIDKANIASAFTKPWVTQAGKTIQPRTTGAIVAINDHYIAQSNGKNYVHVHDRAVLADSKKHNLLVNDLAVGQVLSIGYYNGQGLLSPAQVKEATPAAAEPSKPARQQRPSKRSQAQQAGPSQ